MTATALATAQVRQDPLANLHQLIASLEHLALDLEVGEPNLDPLDSERDALTGALTRALGALLDGDAGDYAAEEVKRAIAQLLVRGGEATLVLPGGLVGVVTMPART